MKCRGPRLKSLFALFERLLAKPGTIARAVTFLGVSRSTVHRWREGIANPRAENVLALDAFVRREVYLLIAERVEGTQASERERAEPLAQPPVERRTVLEPELAAKDVFRTLPMEPVFPPGSSATLQYAAGR